MSERDTEQLKARLAELESLYDRLLSEERSGENLDQRRLRILKSQNIQLERQVVALSDVLQARMEIIADVQNHALELKQALETASKQVCEAHTFFFPFPLLTISCSLICIDINSSYLLDNTRRSTPTESMGYTRPISPI